MVINTFADLCVPDVQAAVGFYRQLLGLGVIVDHGWYAELGTDGRTLLAFVVDGHETVPAELRAPAGGVLLSFEVDDAARAHAAARALDCAVVWPLTEELGQRHFMVRDRNGTLVDVIERIDLTAHDRRRLAAYRHSRRVPVHPTVANDTRTSPC